LRLDRLSARAKQAGGRPPRAGSLPRARSEASGAPPIIEPCRSLLGTTGLLASGRLDGLRVGIVCNPALIDSALRHIADRLVETARPKGPPPTWRAPDGHLRPTARIPVRRAGKHDRDGPRPRRAAPRTRLFALQRNAASRPRKCSATSTRSSWICRTSGRGIYTYIYTMANCLAAAKKHGIKAIVCDRPNPVGGEAVEGPMLQHGSSRSWGSTRCRCGTA